MVFLKRKCNKFIHNHNAILKKKIYLIPTESVCLKCPPISVMIFHATLDVLLERFPGSLVTFPACIFKTNANIHIGNFASHNLDVELTIQGYAIYASTFKFILWLPYEISFQGKSWIDKEI